MAFASPIISSDALEARFAALAGAGRKALVVYVTAGHPDRARSAALLAGLPDAGADVVELGVPFSDPMADGPVIQASSRTALEAGMTFDGTLELAAAAPRETPLVLFTYLNPLLSAGPTALERAADSGIAGILVTDLPLGADPGLERRIVDGPLAFVRLVAPTTPASRMAAIAAYGRGFVYLISRLGVTGEQVELARDLGVHVERLRAASGLPICVGFGISTPAQARAAADLADGVVVGSAIVRAAEEQGVDRALELVRRLRDALDER